MRNCDAFFTATSESRQGGVEAAKKMVAGNQERGGGARPRDRGFHRRPGGLPPDPEGGRGVLPLRRRRTWPTGARSTACCTSRTSRRRRVGAEEYKKKREYFASRAIGGYPFVGSPDHVADELAAAEPRRRARHRLLDDQLSRRAAAIPRRGAAAAGADGRAGKELNRKPASHPSSRDARFCAPRRMNGLRLSAKSRAVALRGPPSAVGLSPHAGRGNGVRGARSIPFAKSDAGSG